MNENPKYQAVRKLLKAQGDKQELINATINAMTEFDKPRKWENIRSWVGTGTGIIALIVSCLVAILK